MGNDTKVLNVIPAKRSASRNLAGTVRMDSGFRRNDGDKPACFLSVLFLLFAFSVHAQDAAPNFPAPQLKPLLEPLCNAWKPSQHMDAIAADAGLINQKTEADIMRGKADDVIHTPAADVAYTPGVDAHGKPVTPAYYDGHQPLAIAPEDISIPIEIPLGNYVNSGAYNADLSKTHIQAGTITLSESGEALFNGQPLSAQPQALDVLCAQLAAYEKGIGD